MKVFDIVTLTVNPSLDKSAAFSGLIPEQKIRCETPHYDAGGGGINVSKAISRLGGTSLCVFTSGGSAGTMLKEILQREIIDLKIIPIKNWTRENFICFDKITNAQYRFGFPGSAISETEQQTILDTVKELKCNYLVISGSLNENLSINFYQQIVEIAKQNGSKVIVDTSGEPLRRALKAGVYLVKPNIGELAKLIGTPKLKLKEVEAAAKKLIKNGNAEIVVVSLGPKGAVLVTKDEVEFVSAPNVVKKSTVGAGDSMVGALVWALSQNKSLKEVIRWGVSCGSAATMNEGTQLFKLKDAKKLFKQLKEK